MRILCTLLTTGVLASLMLNLGINLAKEDKPDGIGSAFSMAALYKQGVCVIPEVSWIILLVNHFREGDYYRLHKLINGWFLPLFNIMDSGISSAPLTGFQLFLMLLLAEIRFNNAFDKSQVRRICRYCQPPFGNFQPFENIICKQHIAA